MSYFRGSPISHAIKKANLWEKKSFRNFFYTSFVFMAIVFISSLLFSWMNIAYKIFEPTMIVSGLILCFISMMLGSYSIFKKAGDSNLKSLMKALIIPGSLVVFIGIMMIYVWLTM